MWSDPKTLVVVAIVSMALVLSPVGARGESEGAAKAQAQARLREGNTLLGQGLATDALMKFVEAYKLFPSPKLHYNLGQAHSLIAGHEAQAYQSMLRFLNEAGDANPQLRAAAEAERQRLRAKVGLLAVSTDPGDAELWVDDVSVGAVVPGSPTVVGIGTHRLALEKAGVLSKPTSVTIAGGDSLDIRLTLAPSVVGRPPASPPVAFARPSPPSIGVVTPPAKLVLTEPTPAPAGFWTWQRKVGVGMAGLGVASLALGVVEHVRYFGKKDEFVNAGCGTDPAYLSNRPDCQRVDNQFKSANAWWIVGYVGAAVFGATSAYLLWPSPAPPAGVSEAARGSASTGFTLNFQGGF
jgi:hypothetical protein